MPKTEKKYIKNINVRISRDQFKQWEKYAQENGFDDISKLVRYATDGLIEGSFKLEQNNQRQNILKNRLNNLEENMKEITKENKEILKLMAKKSTKEIPMKEYRKEIILNILLELGPMTEKQLQKIMKDLELDDLLKLLNELLIMNIIDYEKGHYYYKKEVN